VLDHAARVYRELHVQRPPLGEHSDRLHVLGGAGAVSELDAQLTAPPACKVRGRTETGSYTLNAHDEPQFADV